MVVGLLPMIVTTLGAPLLSVVVMVCVTSGGAVVINWPALVSVTMITVGKVVLKHRRNEFKKTRVRQVKNVRRDRSGSRRWCRRRRCCGRGCRARVHEWLADVCFPWSHSVETVLTNDLSSCSGSVESSFPAWPRVLVAGYGASGFCSALRGW